MTDPFALALVFKLATLAVGYGCVYLGYRLFLHGSHAGGTERIEIARWLVVRGGGPGIFFAVVGGGILYTTVYRGLDMSRTTTGPVAETVSAGDHAHDVETTSSRVAAVELAPAADAEPDGEQQRVLADVPPAGRAPVQHVQVEAQRAGPAR